MTSFSSQRSSIQSTSSLLSQQMARRPSSITPTPADRSNPRVQLLPRSRNSSHDGALSPSDIEILANTNFDSHDLSSKDFDFADVFTYDKPQKKLRSVVEVSSRDRDWSNFSFSHYQTAVNMRQKVNRSKLSTAEMYVRNSSEARRR